DHRLKELRQTTAAALPGKSLVVLDPALGLAIDVIPCEDGHGHSRGRGIDRDGGHRWGFPCRTALRAQACRRHYPGGAAGGIGSPPGCPRRRPSLLFRQVGCRISRFEACSAFTHVTACLLAESPEATLSIEGSGSFVASTAAPIATGRSDSCRVGVAPT